MLVVKSSALILATAIRLTDLLVKTASRGERLFRKLISLAVNQKQHLSEIDHDAG